MLFPYWDSFLLPFCFLQVRLGSLWVLLWGMALVGLHPLFSGAPSYISSSYPNLFGVPHSFMNSLYPVYIPNMFTDFVHFTLPLLIFIPYHSSFPISSSPILAPLHHIQVVTFLNFLHQHPINLQHLYLSFHFSGCSSVGYITQ